MLGRRPKGQPRGREEATGTYPPQRPRRRKEDKETPKPQPAKDPPTKRRRRKDNKQSWQKWGGGLSM